MKMILIKLIQCLLIFLIICKVYIDLNKQKQNKNKKQVVM